LIEVKIERLVHLGMGIGRINGKRIFIPFSSPGDRLLVKVRDIKRDYIKGDIINILEPSQYRREPVCSLFSICGGCHLQHIDYEYQIKFKEEIFLNLLRKIGKLKDIEIRETIPSKKPFFYRNRVQLKAKNDNNSIIGFYKLGSRDIVEVNKCFIVDPSINSLIGRLKSFLININLPLKGLDIITDGTNLLVSLKMDKYIKDVNNLFNNSFKEIKGIKIGSRSKKRYLGEYYLYYNINNINMKISGDTFAQVNPYQNLELIKLVSKIAGLSGGEKVLDLYAGIGNLTIPLAINSKYIKAVERNKKAVEYGKINAKLNNIKNLEFIHGDVRYVLDNIKKEFFDLIIIDPPRGGCKDIIHKLNSDRIIYISCDPATLARDLNIFLSLSYIVKEIYFIDMFPNTYHIEGVIKIEKN